MSSYVQQIQALTRTHTQALIQAPDASGRAAQVDLFLQGRACLEGESDAINEAQRLNDTTRYLDSDAGGAAAVEEDTTSSTARMVAGLPMTDPTARASGHKYLRLQVAQQRNRSRRRPLLEELEVSSDFLEVLVDESYQGLPKRVRTRQLEAQSAQATLRNCAWVLRMPRWWLLVIAAALLLVDIALSPIAAAWGADHVATTWPSQMAKQFKISCVHILCAYVAAYVLFMVTSQNEKHAALVAQWAAILGLCEAAAPTVTALVPPEPAVGASSAVAAAGPTGQRDMLPDFRTIPRSRWPATVELLVQDVESRMMADMLPDFRTVPRSRWPATVELLVQDVESSMMAAPPGMLRAKAEASSEEEHEDASSPRQQEGGPWRSMAGANGWANTACQPGCIGEDDRAGAASVPGQCNDSCFQNPTYDDEWDGAPERTSSLPSLLHALHEAGVDGPPLVPPTTTAATPALPAFAARQCAPAVLAGAVPPQRSSLLAAGRPSHTGSVFQAWADSGPSAGAQAGRQAAWLSDQDELALLLQGGDQPDDRSYPEGFRKPVQPRHAGTVDGVARFDMNKEQPLGDISGGSGRTDTTSGTTAGIAGTGVGGSGSVGGNKKSLSYRLGPLLDQTDYADAAASRFAAFGIFQQPLPTPRP